MRTRTTINFLFFSLASAASLTSCGGGSNDFKTDTASGVQYRFIKQDDNGAKPAENSFAKVQMYWMGKNIKGEDSVCLDSHKKGFGDSNGVLLQAIQLHKSFSGCLEQGIMMMAKGDSAVFKINADSLYEKTFRFPKDRLPACLKYNQTFTFGIKLVSFQTAQERQTEMQGEMQKRMAMAQARKAQESSDITAFLQKNYPNAKPDADSIFYLSVTKGSGKQVKEGDSIQVGYVGHLLDGTVFDRSDKGPGHGTFGLKYSKDQNVIRVIQGWIDVLGKMHEGDKVTVLIPSAKAYGPRGMGAIMPYSPLVFDIEMVSVKSGK